MLGQAIDFLLYQLIEFVELLYQFILNHIDLQHPFGGIVGGEIQGLELLDGLQDSSKFGIAIGFFPSDRQLRFRLAVG